MADIYDVKNYDPQNNVGNLINRARSELCDALDRELASLDMTAAQCVVVSMLACGCADSSSQICKEITYDTGAMTRMVDRLEKKGFLRRVRNKEDRRVVCLELTERGKEMLPDLRASTVTVMNQFLHNLTNSEVKQLEGFLKRMLPQD